MICISGIASAEAEEIVVDVRQVLSNVERKPGGFVTNWLLDSMVQTNRVAGPVRAFASHTAKDGKLVVYLINKSDKPVAASIRLEGTSPRKVESRTVYAGAGYDDLDPKLEKDQEATLSGGKATTTLPGVSLTILTLH